MFAKLLLAFATFSSAALLAGFTRGSAQAVPDTALQALIDERAAIRVVDSIDLAVDAKDWTGARSYFADRVRTDFSSLTGQAPATTTSDALVGAWAANLKGSKSSFHQRSNHRVALGTGHATVTSSGYAWNRMEGNGDPLWEVWGTYEHSLVRTDRGWKVEGMTLRVTHERGNMWVKMTPGR